MMLGWRAACGAQTSRFKWGVEELETLLEGSRRVEPWMAEL